MMMTFGGGKCDHVIIFILVEKDWLTAFGEGKCNHD